MATVGVGRLMDGDWGAWDVERPSPLPPLRAPAFARSAQAFSRARTGGSSMRALTPRAGEGFKL